MTLQRLQKFLASAGLGARRNCEELVTMGRITVNGKTVSELSTMVDPEKDKISCDGQTIKPEEKVHFLLNKPEGVLCTTAKSRTRMRAIDYIPNKRGLRLFTVGRLDVDTEGLIIVTNDGELSQHVAHPRNEFPKTYRAHVTGNISGESVDQLRKGVFLKEGKTSPAQVRIIKRSRTKSVLEITIHEGFNRQVRRMFSRVGHTVTYLCRTSIGPIKLGSLKPGMYKILNQKEVDIILAHRPPKRLKAPPRRNRPNKGKSRK